MRLLVLAIPALLSFSAEAGPPLLRIPCPAQGICTDAEKAECGDLASALLAHLDAQLKAGEEPKVAGAKPLSGRVEVEDGDVTRVTVAALSPDWRVITWTRPAANGDFELRGLSPGKVRIVAWTKDRLPDVEEQIMLEGHRVFLRLPRGRTLRGRAQVDGRPAAGARATLEGIACHQQVVIDGGGGFEFQQVPPGEYDVMVDQGGLGGDASLMVKGNVTEAPLVHLAPRGRVRGVVRGPGGAPIAFARVRAIEMPWTSHGWSADAFTDERGRYEIGALPGAMTHLSVLAPGMVSVSRELKTPPGKTQALDFSLIGCARLAGAVVAPDGARLGGAWIEVDGERTERTKTEEDGRFEVTCLAPGKHSAVASHPGFAPRTFQLAAPSKDNMLQLPAGGTIIGRVVVGAGEPVPEVEVEVRPLGQRIPGFDNYSKDTTEQSGRFAARGLPEGRFAVIATWKRSVGARYPVSRQLWREVAVAAGAQVDIGDLQFAPSAELRGVVKDESGAPIADAEVTCSVELGRGTRERELNVGANYMGVRTDSRGRFVCAHADPVEHSYYVKARDFAAAYGELGPNDPVTVTLRREVKLRGRVLGPDRMPLTRFSLYGLNYASADGRFERFLPSGSKYPLRVSAPGLAEVQLPLPSDATQDVDVGDVVLGPGQVLRGAVIDARTGAPVAGVRISVWRHNSNIGRAETGPGGTFETEPLSPGLATVTVQQDEFGWVQQEVECCGKSIEVRLDPGAHLHGRAGAPGALEGAVISASRGREEHHAEIAPDGSFELAGLTAGTWTVRPIVERFGTGPVPDVSAYDPRSIDVDGRERRQLDFAPRSGGVPVVLHSAGKGWSVAVLVRGTHDRPKTIERLRELTTPSPLTYRREGAWRFAAVAPGEYTVFLIERWTWNLVAHPVHLHVGGEALERAVEIPSDAEEYPGIGPVTFP